MKYILISIVLLAYFLHLNNADFYSDSDIDQLFENYELGSNWTNSSRNCSIEESVCVTCTVSRHCTIERNGSISEHYHKCLHGTTCLYGQCVNTTNPNCTFSGDFECRTPGMYPDPFDCKTYHYCVQREQIQNTSSLIKFTSKCDCDYGYNPYTKACDIKLQNKNCFYNEIPHCYEKGQSHALSSNPSIYYICLENYSSYNGTYLYPYLYGCDHGKKYDSNTYICR